MKHIEHSHITSCIEVESGANRTGSDIEVDWSKLKSLRSSLWRMQPLRLSMKTDHLSPKKKNQCDAVIKKLSPGNRLPLYFLLTYCILTGVTLITVNQGQRTDYICSHGSSPDVLLFPFPPPLCHAVSFSLSPPPSFFFPRHTRCLLLALCNTNVSQAESDRWTTVKQIWPWRLREWSDSNKRL